MISVQNLDFRYSPGTFRLVVPRLDVTGGDLLAVVGASGSGKTTLLNIMAGIHAPNAGTVSVGGNDLSTLTDKQCRDLRISQIGMIFQGFELLEYLTVRDNLLLPYRISAALEMNDDVETRLERLGIETGIGDLMQRFPSELSQGERQRAAICRALITSPSLILADEPTGNLDPENKQRVLRLLLDQAARHKATLVMVTHDHDLLSPFDRVLDMREYHGGAPV
jgi:putative ABC transport system ATP-binding protein